MLRGLRAGLYKDWRLVFRGGGWAALLAPLVLLAALGVGMGDGAGQMALRPFPIAVRDLDNTLMSRSLRYQMEQVELFSRLYTLAPGEPDQSALDRGAAAVVTIPEDFFYDLYRMEDCPVDVTLNGDMPLEAALFRAIFASVMDIIAANQTAALGLYRFCYGTLDPAQEARLYAQASEQLLRDALGRQAVFDAPGQAGDLAGALERRLAACVLACAALFFALSAVKTLPEEARALGVLPRLRGAGCPWAAAVLSKLAVAGLLMLPTLAGLWYILRPARPGAVLALAGLLLAGAFGLLLGLCAWAGSAGRTQRWGNVLLLASLALGGTLCPHSLLPAPLAALGRLTLPCCAHLGLEALQAGYGPGMLLRLLWPVPAQGLAGLLLALAALRRRRTGRISAPPGPAAPADTVPLGGTAARLLGLSRFKLRAMAGGGGGLALLLAAALLCGMAAGAGQNSAAALGLAAVDRDGSALSRDLLARLEGQEVALSRWEEEDAARQSLLLGGAEALLVIEPGYGGALERGENPALSCRSAPSAQSLQGVRELVAGQVAVQRSRLRALDQAPELLGRPLAQGEAEALLAEIQRLDRTRAPLFHLRTRSGRAPAAPFTPSPVSFAALAVLFTLLTAAAWGGVSPGRAAERRMAGLPQGRLLARGSDCLALTALGGMVALAVLLPAGQLGGGVLPAVGCLSFCAAGLALALGRFTAQEGRVDGLAPFLALILCLLGGCFLDLSQLSPGLAALSLLTPPGLALAAARGSLPALAALGLEGAALLALSWPRRG